MGIEAVEALALALGPSPEAEADALLDPAASFEADAPLAVGAPLAPELHPPKAPKAPAAHKHAAARTNDRRVITSAAAPNTPPHLDKRKVIAC